MQIDLKDPEQNTIENFRNLLRSSNDDKNTQFRVSNDGFLYLSESTGSNDLEGVLFRLETNIKGNGYVGNSAADDDVWVNSLFKGINKNYPNPQASFIDNF